MDLGSGLNFKMIDLYFIQFKEDKMGKLDKAYSTEESTAIRSSTGSSESGVIKSEPMKSRSMKSRSIRPKPIKSWPLQERPRERLIHYGASVLSDAELLAILLRTGVTGCSVLDLSRELLSVSKGLRGLLALPADEFVALRGMGEAKYAQLQAALELSKRFLQESLEKETQLSSSQHTKKFLSLKLREKQHEVFAVLFLDAQNRLIQYKELFRGSITGASVSIREVVKESLACNAASIIVAHNHPSGVAEPSTADKTITHRLIDALALMDVRLIDHIIVGDTDCTSFAETGLI
jgi:DNA repair protein RadC